MTLTELKSVIDNLFQTTNAAPYNGSNDFVVGVKLCPDEEDVTVEISDVIGIEFGKDWNSGKVIIHVKDQVCKKEPIQEIEEPLVVEDDPSVETIRLLNEKIASLEATIGELRGVIFSMNAAKN